MLAVSADRVLRGQATYKTLLMWVYAIAPPVAGLMGNLMFNPLIGDLYKFANLMGWDFDHKLDTQAGRNPAIIAAFAQRPYSSKEAGVTSVTCRLQPTGEGVRIEAQIAMPSAGGEEVAIFEPGDPAIRRA